MTEYKIKRWDVILKDNSITMIPIIYVEPDLEFLSFVKANDYAVMAEISGTGMVYDGKKIPGVVDKSCFVPNCRPNYYEKTGYYVVSLMGPWNGYPNPDQLGVVKFKGMKSGKEDDDKQSTTKLKSLGIEKKLYEGFSATHLYILGLSLFAIFLILFFFLRK